MHPAHASTPTMVLLYFTPKIEPKISRLCRQQPQPHEPHHEDARSVPYILLNYEVGTGMHVLDTKPDLAVNTRGNKMKEDHVEIFGIRKLQVDPMSTALLSMIE
jgi:hypothetical protein